MRIGIFADAHDHVDNVVRAVAEFNRRGCELVLFAGDFCSPIVVPPLRRLRCPLIACFGDNDGNRVGIEGGMRIIGPVGSPPLCVRAADGTRVLMAHVPAEMRGMVDGVHVVVTAHTHRPSTGRDADGRLFVSPGETGGWSFRKPSVAIVETKPLAAEIVWLPEMPRPPEDFTQRS
ncbi:MAG: YfcE family phosphodiesterase [Planctomycetes bacterium]|nr:YfcE family phosphodiesterase [Planctomycetota bacterium]